MPRAAHSSSTPTRRCARTSTSAPHAGRSSAPTPRPARPPTIHRIQLLANIGTVEDARAAAATAAEGVGLFRTEFLFLGRAQEPSIEEQTARYREVLEAFDGRKVVIRTLDAGADKPIAFAGTLTEANPALGVRAYRLSRRAPQVLRHQLEALAQAIAAVPGADAQVMAPMISTPAEAREFQALATECGLSTVGVMVEVPAAALTADRLLEPLDFASIGTNDLAQYTMASDRELGDLADLIDRWQPAILQLIESTAQAGAALGRPVGVCGESAADPVHGTGPVRSRRDQPVHVRGGDPACPLRTATHRPGHLPGDGPRRTVRPRCHPGPAGRRLTAQR